MDAPIVSLIELINAQPDLFTTSSCSGRVSVFAEPTEATRAAGKKGGEWVFASHERSDPDEVLRSIKERMGTGAASGLHRGCTCSWCRWLHSIGPYLLLGAGTATACAEEVCRVSSWM